MGTLQQSVQQDMGQLFAVCTTGHGTISLIAARTTGHGTILLIAVCTTGHGTILLIAVHTTGHGTILLIAVRTTGHVKILLVAVRTTGHGTVFLTAVHTTGRGTVLLIAGVFYTAGVTAICNVCDELSKTHSSMVLFPRKIENQTLSICVMLLLYDCYLFVLALLLLHSLILLQLRKSCC